MTDQSNHDEDPTPHPSSRTEEGPGADPVTEEREPVEAGPPADGGTPPGPREEPPAEGERPTEPAPVVGGRSGEYQARATPPPPARPSPGPAVPAPAAEPRAGAASGRRWVVVVVAALIGALVGGGVAAGVVIAGDDDEPARVVERGSDTGPNTSVIEVADDVQSILENIEPAVVSVRTRSLDLNLFLEPVPSEGAGTGFIIDSEGVIVTTDHVIEGAQRIEVVLSDGETEQAEVLGRDPELDIAVLQIDGSGLPEATLGSSEELRVGDDVVAIGNALALAGGPTVTRGIVSAKDRTLAAPGGVRLEAMLQTDAAINPGNSGGPLVNAAGEVVGINTAIIQGAENIGFAMAIDPIRSVIDDLRTGEPVVRPFLGVQTITIDEQIARQFDIETEEGALVLEVIAGSSAEAAGIQRGDVIVEIAGEEVASSGDVASLVREHEPDEEIEIVVVRGDDRQTLTATLGSRTVGG